MKSNALAFAIAAASLGFSALTLAQDHDRRAGREDPARATQQVYPREIYRVDQRADRREERREERREDRREDRREERRDDRRDDRWGHRGDDRRDYRGHDARVFRGHDHGAYYNARGPQFRRGGYIPREFRNQQYQVVDYRAYRLSAPPRGHQWVQVGADYVLIAIATGLIAHIVLNY